MAIEKPNFEEDPLKTNENHPVDNNKKNTENFKRWIFSNIFKIIRLFFLFSILIICSFNLYYVKNNITHRTDPKTELNQTMIQHGEIHSKCYINATLDASRIGGHVLYWNVIKKNCIAVSRGSDFQIIESGQYDVYTRLDLSSPSVEYFQHCLEVVRANGENDCLDLVKIGLECEKDSPCHSDLRNRNAFLKKGDKIRVTMSNPKIVQGSKSVFELKQVHI